jgi:hypothetical protein
MLWKLRLRRLIVAEFADLEVEADSEEHAYDKANDMAYNNEFGDRLDWEMIHFPDAPEAEVVETLGVWDSRPTPRQDVELPARIPLTVVGDPAERGMVDWESVTRQL